MSLISCPECERRISSAASACSGCGHPLLPVVGRTIAAGSGSTPVTQVVHVQVGDPNYQRRWNPLLAAILSLILPGLGQLYKGQVFNGIAWFIVVAIGYAALIVPGLLLHFCCIIGAAVGNPRR